jgi:hypothetical protein
MDDADITRQVVRAFQRYRFRYTLDDLAQRRRQVGILTAPRIAVLGATLLAVAVWLAVASPLAVTPTVAFVGWESTPDAPDVNFTTAARQACHAGSSMTLMAQDQRGNAATLLYAEDGELALCLVAKDSAGSIVAAASGFTHLEAPDGPLSVDTGLSAPESAQSPGVRIMAGRAAAPIAAVQVARSDGVEVIATVSSGYWVAWWPTSTEGTTVTATDSDGVVVAVEEGLN